MASRQSLYRGCLLGMAVGDAMGYTVDNKSWQEDTDSPYKWTQIYTSMDTTERRPYGLMHLMEQPCHLSLFANLQTDLVEDMKPKEDQFLFSDSRKSLYQQSNTQLFGGVHQKDTTEIPSNFTVDSPNAITWDLQEEPQMEILNTPFHWNSTQENLEPETMKKS